MSKKAKGRKTLSLAEFVGKREDDLEWARDEFAPTPEMGPAQPGEAVPGMQSMGKRGGDWQKFGFKVGNMDGNFREMAPVQNTRVVPDDMQPPYVAYVGNLPQTILQETVKDQFAQVVDARLIKHDKSTFAYVEFETKEALQAAILMAGKTVGGRKIRVDIASDAQRARLEQERGGASRESAVIGRDAMGSAQPVGPGLGSGRGSRMGSRNPSNMDLAFSRDAMGAAQPTGESPVSGGGGFGFGGPTEISRDAFGEAKPRTPNSQPRGGLGFRDRSKPASPVAQGSAPRFGGGFGSAGGGEPDFAGWRNSDKVEQPDKPDTPVTTGAPAFARRTPKRDGEGEGDAKEGEREAKEEKPSVPDRGSWRDAPPTAKTAAPSAGGWRDAPAKPSAAATAAPAPAPKPAAKALAPELSWRDAPKAATPAATNPWRQGPPAATK